MKTNWMQMGKGSGKAGWQYCGLIMLALTVGLAGCKTSPAPDSEEAAAVHNTSGPLELNQGRKWVVPEPMMAHVRELENSVQKFEAAPNGDHAALGTEIQNRLGQVVTNCTMQGKAHDELHKWLLPFLGLTAEYARADVPQIQQDKLGEIRQSLAVFHEYFE